MREIFPVRERAARGRAGAAAEAGFQMGRSDIEDFVGRLKADLSPSTVARYRRALLAFYDALPADKRVREDTLANWVESLTDTYSAAHVNMLTSACNAFLRYRGYESYQLTSYIGKQEPSPAALTREEYLHLLTTARAMGKPLAYLAMRAFACTDMEMADFLALTVEAVRDGTTAVRLPDSLREELLDYALHNGVRGGRIFVGRGGEPLRAETVRLHIKAVSKATGFGAGKACVRTLRKLYEQTRVEITAQTVERLMIERAEQEQTEHGWES